MGASYRAKLKKAYSVPHHATFTALIQEAKGRMEPYRPILEAAANIEGEHGRQEALAQAVPLLKHLDTASNALPLVALLVFG